MNYPVDSLEEASCSVCLRSLLHPLAPRCFKGFDDFMPSTPLTADAKQGRHVGAGWQD